MNTKRNGKPASTDDLWKLHRQLILWFVAYLESANPKSGAVIAEIVKFLSDNGAVVNARNEKELKSHAEVMAALTIPFPSATKQ